MTNSVNKIDYFAINKIIDKVVSSVFNALPHPIFKLTFIIKAAKIFGIISILILLIGLILTLKKAMEYKDKTNLLITEYKNGKPVKTSSRIIDQKADNKCINITDKLTGEKKYKKCNKKVQIWLKYLIYTGIGFLLPLLFIMPVANIMFAKKKYFSNPHHNILIDYLLRFFYPLKWGEVWDNQKYDNVRKGALMKAMYGKKK